MMTRALKTADAVAFWIVIASIGGMVISAIWRYQFGVQICATALFGGLSIGLCSLWIAKSR